MLARSLPRRKRITGPTPTPTPSQLQTGYFGVSSHVLGFLLALPRLFMGIASEILA